MSKPLDEALIDAGRAAPAIQGGRDLAGRGGLRRVVITGAGTINALGHDVASTMQAFRDGRCGITQLEFRDVDRLSIQIGAQVHDWTPETYFNRQQILLYDKFTQFTLLAAKQAVEQAGLHFQGALGLRSGVVLGTAGGGLNTWDENYRAVYEEGKNRVHPFVVPKLMNNAAASHVSMEFGLRGPAFTVATACASSNHAMGLAFQMVRSGAADVMLSGGSEAMLCFGGVKAWEGLRVMSPDGCRPFDARRNGMVMGEGAAVFVLEAPLVPIAEQDNRITNTPMPAAPRSWPRSWGSPCRLMRRTSSCRPPRGPSARSLAR